jgi:hypothetical protein
LWFRSNPNPAWTRFSDDFSMQLHHLAGEQRFKSSLAGEKHRPRTCGRSALLRPKKRHPQSATLVLFPLSRSLSSGASGSEEKE